MKKPNSLLFATPNFHLLLTARPKIILISPYEILLKNVSPCALCTKTKLLLECFMNSGNPDTDQGNSTVSPPSAQSVD